LAQVQAKPLAQDGSSEQALCEMKVFDILTLLLFQAARFHPSVLETWSPSVGSALQGYWIEPTADVQDRINRAVWYKQTPIIVINRDRMYVRRFVIQMHAMGYFNIYILDNWSTYKPLLAFYRTGAAWVCMLKHNFGSRVLWEAGPRMYWSKTQSFESYIDTNYLVYVYADGDCVFTADTPHYWLYTFYRLMVAYNVAKVGPSLLYDDIPSTYPARQDVWDFMGMTANKRNSRKRPTTSKDVFYTWIDTTLALYSKKIQQLRSLPDAFLWGDMPGWEHLEVGGRCSIRHLPWYEDPFWDPPDVVHYERHRRKGNAYSGFFTGIKGAKANTSQQAKTHNALCHSVLKTTHYILVQSSYTAHTLLSQTELSATLASAPYSPHAHHLIERYHTVLNSSRAAVFDVGCRRSHQPSSSIARLGRIVFLDICHSAPFWFSSAASSSDTASRILHLALNLDGNDELASPVALRMFGAIIICSEVMQYLEKPDSLLRQLRQMFEHGAELVLLTIPSSEASYVGDNDGPPRHPHHVREWSRIEFLLMLRCIGLPVASLTVIGSVLYAVLTERQVPSPLSLLHLGNGAADSLAT